MITKIYQSLGQERIPISCLNLGIKTIYNLGVEKLISSTAMAQPIFDPWKMGWDDLACQHNTGHKMQHVLSLNGLGHPLFF